MPQNNVGCNYISLPEIPASGDKVLVCARYTQHHLSMLNQPPDGRGRVAMAMLHDGWNTSWIYHERQPPQQQPCHQLFASAAVVQAVRLVAILEYAAVLTMIARNCATHMMPRLLWWHYLRWALLFFCKSATLPLEFRTHSHSAALLMWVCN